MPTAIPSVGPTHASTSVGTTHLCGETFAVIFPTTASFAVATLCELVMADFRIKCRWVSFEGNPNRPVSLRHVRWAVLTVVAVAIHVKLPARETLTVKFKAARPRHSSFYRNLA